MLRLFSHYIPASLVILLLVEAVVLYFSVYLGIELRFIDSSNKAHSISLLEPVHYKALVFSLLMLLSMTAMGLHTRNIVDNFSSMMIRLFLSFGAGFFIVAIIYYIYPQLFLGRGVVGFTFVVSFIGILLTRTIHQNIDNQNETVTTAGQVSGYTSGLNYGRRGNYYNSWERYYSNRDEIIYTPPASTNFVILTIESTLYDKKRFSIVQFTRMQNERYSGSKCYRFT